MQTKDLILALATLAQCLQPTLADEYPYTAEQKLNANRTLSIGYVVYHGYTILDVFGPLQFISDLSWPLPINLSIISHQTGPIHSNPPPHHGPDGLPMDMSKMIDAAIIATHTFSTAPPLDALFVPGGVGDLTLLETNDRQIEDFIASRYESTKYVLSVCTGAGFLARAGVLDGRRATATKSVWKYVTQWGTNVTWVPSARWVRAEGGKLWTSSGVTAGMDMTVAWLREVYGDPEVARKVNQAEYLGVGEAAFDPFSVVFEVPGANLSIPLEGTVRPMPVYA
ncbi:isonitrile hydratase [Podospora conica]|nr:isonitrile hydratase [Schizothecium conicum]